VRARWIGPAIEVRLRELVETGEIVELTEFERELVPGLAWSPVPDRRAQI
jgi:hypothetical protein